MTEEIDIRTSLTLAEVGEGVERRYERIKSRYFALMEDEQSLLALRREHGELTFDDEQQLRVVSAEVERYRPLWEEAFVYLNLVRAHRSADEYGLTIPGVRFPTAYPMEFGTHE